MLGHLVPSSVGWDSGLEPSANGDGAKLKCKLSISSGTFFGKLWRHREKAAFVGNILHCTKMTKKERKTSNGDY